jgi:ribosomal-protein-alanine N-acetyltransferase
VELWLEWNVQFTVRKYRPQDFRTLWKIDQSCFPPGISYTPFELKTFIHRWGSFTLVAEAEPAARPGTEETKADISHAILGFLVGERRRRSGHIITIDVRSEARRHRVGTALLESAESRMRLWNCDLIRLETSVDNLAALSFYKRHGYTITKVVPRYYSNGLDALVLEKHLLSPSSSDKLLE